MVDDATLLKVEELLAEFADGAAEHHLGVTGPEVAECGLDADLVLFNQRDFNKELECMVASVIREDANIATLHGCTLPKAVWKAALEDGQYVKFVMKVKGANEAKSKLWKILREQRAGEWWGAAQHGISDIQQTTLIIIGRDGKVTGLHLDWTEAKNVAFALGQVWLACCVCRQPCSRV